MAENSTDEFMKVFKNNENEIHSQFDVIVLLTIWYLHFKDYKNENYDEVKFNHTLVEKYDTYTAKL